MSVGVLAKPGIAKDFIEADGIGRNAVADFIEKSVFHNPIKCYKLKTIEACEAKKKFSNLQNAISQNGA